MKNNLIEILSYILKKCVREDMLFSPNSEEVINRLRLSGVSEENINKAFSWLAILNQQPYPTNIHANSNSLRIFDDPELKKIGKDGYGFIIFLERAGILNAKTREMVITQLMLLPQTTCQLMEIKWVAIVVLISCTDKIEIDTKLSGLALLMNEGISC